MADILDRNFEETIDELVAGYRARARGAAQADATAVTDHDIAIIRDWAGRALTNAALIELVLEGKLRITVEDGEPKFDDGKAPSTPPKGSPH
jgi:hypothetical protein